MVQKRKIGPTVFQLIYSLLTRNKQIEGEDLIFLCVDTSQVYFTQTRLFIGDTFIIQLGRQELESSLNKFQKVQV